MAECHPVGFQWVMEAKRRGATIIHVDPRFTRTSAVADIHVPIRAGSDIVFLGAIVRYILENERYFREYVVNYTNAATLISEDYKDTEDLDGIFSGWEREKASTTPSRGSTKTSKWVRRRARARCSQASRNPNEGCKWGRSIKTRRSRHPRCVFQILKRHFARYTPEMVAEVCGVEPPLFLKVAEALCRNSGRERTSAFCYAVGWTQHPSAYSISARRPSFRRCWATWDGPAAASWPCAATPPFRDRPTSQPYITCCPAICHAHAERRHDLRRVHREQAPQFGLVERIPQIRRFPAEGLLWRCRAKENGWCFDYLPLLTGDHSHMTTYADMADGRVKGYFVMGENPVVGSMNGAFQCAPCASSTGWWCATSS